MYKRVHLLLTGLAVLVVFLGTRSAMLSLRPTPEVVEPLSWPESFVTVDEQGIKRYKTVGAYFRDAHPEGTATTHRLGLPPIKRDVSERLSLIHI